MDNFDPLSEQLKALEQPIADNGFTDQVMARITHEGKKAEAQLNPAKQLSIETWVILFALATGLAIALFNFPLISLGHFLVEQSAQIISHSRIMLSGVGILLIGGWSLTALGCGWSLMQLR